MQKCMLMFVIVERDKQSARVAYEGIGVLSVQPAVSGGGDRKRVQVIRNIRHK